MRRQGWWLLWVLAFFMALGGWEKAALGQGESRQVQVEGVAAVEGGNVALARDRALEDALRRAVEQAVGILVSAETAVQNQQLLSDKIYTHAQGYVRSYKVVSQRQDGNLYRVSILAQVGLDALKSDLAAINLLMERVGKPRVMFLISEEIAQVGWYGWSWKGASVAETTFIRRFQDQGFLIVDPKAGQVNDRQAQEAVRGDTGAAQALGKRLNADVVVVGQARAQGGSRISGSDLRSVIGDLTVRAVKVDNGVVIATASASATAPHVEVTAGAHEAFGKAAAEASGTLMNRILDRWAKETTSGGLVQVGVAGIASFDQLQELISHLKGKVRGVTQVYRRDFRQGQAVLDVEMKGSAQDLADALHNARVGKAKVAVVSLTGSRLEIRLTQ